MPQSSKLRMQTKEELQRTIDFYRLHCTTSDAIQLTNFLRVPFLWIDAFCIQQDEDEDWVREAALIDQVYLRVVVLFTLAAAPFHYCDGGFLTALYFKKPFPASRIGKGGYWPIWDWTFTKEPNYQVQ